MGAQEAVHHAIAAMQGSILLSYIDPNQYLSPLKIGCDCTEATGRALCRRVSVSSGSCNVKCSCWVGQRGDKINALAARRASLSGAQQSLKRSLATLPGQLQFLLEAPVGLASLHKHACTGLETSHSS